MRALSRQFIFRKLVPQPVAACRLFRAVCPLLGKKGEFDAEFKSIMNPKRRVLIENQQLKTPKRNEELKIQILKNEEIKSETVKVSDSDKYLGLMSLQDALKLAREADSDLLQLSTVDPPFCRIMKFSDYLALQQLVLGINF